MKRRSTTEDHKLRKETPTRLAARSQDKSPSFPTGTQTIHRTLLTSLSSRQCLLGRRELGDSLGTLRDGVLGKLSGEDKTDRGLDLSGRDGRSVVVRSELGGLGRDSLEDVGDEGVEDGHGLVAEMSVDVDADG